MEKVITIKVKRLGTKDLNIQTDISYKINASKFKSFEFKVFIEELFAIYLDKGIEFSVTTKYYKDMYFFSSYNFERKLSNNELDNLFELDRLLKMEIEDIIAFLAELKKEIKAIAEEVNSKASTATTIETRI